MTIVFLGPPGSGKGTQRQLLAARLGLPSIATGDIVRRYSSRAGSGDRLADEIHDRYVKGIPQPDAFINQAMDGAVGELFSPPWKEGRPPTGVQWTPRNEEEGGRKLPGIIFDAYPLSQDQAEGFTQVVKKYNLGYPRIIFLQVSLESVLRRLQSRMFCRKCNAAYLPADASYQTGTCGKCGGQLYVRPDDKPDVVKKRYEEYERRGNALHEYYRQHSEEGEWIEVNGEQSVEDVHREIVKKLGIES